MPAVQTLVGIFLWIGVAHTLSLDHSSGTTRSGVKGAARTQIARPDEGLVMHCNVTGTNDKTVTGRKALVRFTENTDLQDPV